MGKFNDEQVNIIDAIKMVSKIMPNAKIKSQITNILIIGAFAFPYIFLNIPSPGDWISVDIFAIYDTVYKITIYFTVTLFIIINILASIRQIPKVLLFFFVFITPFFVVLNLQFAPYVLMFAAVYFLIENIKQGLYSLNIVRVMIILSLLFSFIQSLYFRSEDGRPALSFIDPNFSAFYIFMLFAVSYNLRLKIIMYLCFALGMFMLSRAFLLAVVVFWILNNTTFFYTFAKRCKVYHPFVMVILSLFLVFTAGTALRTFGGNDVADYDSGISRFSTINDGSNRLRFQLNDQFLSALTQSRELQLHGVTKEFYTANFAPLIPHNGFFEFVRLNGLLLAIIYISFVFLFILNKSVKSTFPLLFSYILYMCFLPVIPAGISLLLVSVIYAVTIYKMEYNHVGNNRS
ncbi:TPA: hypothetical protein MNB55_004134 [Citrobacter farmeri]|uniref:hypothetical protein n=1 Tax=Citrobacter farmeri TaxID=67824 RepID=UPI0018A02EB1|nr:hypothetical protein [Citrobacter farmeri]EHK0944416.1 hypothetical protein [Citrobacter farmeri]EKX4539773.1 hypothetical protein [Citrobacter farmeri]MDB2162795.1 hypothetical protein [Citrobacter farmeri]HBC0357712.1 hypothetical protein [Citrobacter farmeri]HBZ8835896.1 hypothetical protein [Citrobacter farmeri]